MQVAATEISFREEASLSLVPLAQGSSVKLVPGAPSFQVSNFTSSSQLLDVSNRFGFTVAASSSGSGLVLAQSAQVKQSFVRNEVSHLAQGINIPTPSQATFVKFAYADLYVVAVLQDGQVLVFALKQLLTSHTAPQSSFNLPSPAIDLLPNPDDKPELLAVLLSNGQLAMLDISSASGSQPPLFGSQIASACWSARGKQIVCGLANGSLVQLAPDGTEKSSVVAPQDLQEPHQVVDVRWLENDIFYIACVPTTPPSDGLPPLTANYIILRTKTSLTYARLADDPVQPFGTHENRPTKRYVAHAKGIGPFKHFLVLAASNSPDIALVACDANSGEWAVLELDDNARASLPSTSDGENTCPFSLTLDCTTSAEAESPTLFTYTSDAVAVAWALRSNNADLKRSLVQPQDVATASDQPTASTTPAPATPVTTPSFGSSSTPAFSSKPAFGQSTFGQSSFSSSAFGTAASPSTPALPGASSTGAFSNFSSPAKSSTPTSSGFGGFSAPQSNTTSGGFGSFSPSSGGAGIFGNSLPTSGSSPFTSSTFGGTSSSPSSFGTSAQSPFGSSTPTKPFGGSSSTPGLSGLRNAVKDDDDDDEFKPTPAAAAPGLGEMDADELEPESKEDQSSKLGFGGFGLGSSKPQAAPAASTPSNPMFGSFGGQTSSATAPTTPSGFSGFGKSSTGFGDTFAAPSLPTASAEVKPTAPTQNSSTPFSAFNAPPSSSAPSMTSTFGAPSKPTAGFSFAPSKPTTEAGTSSTTDPSAFTSVSNASTQASGFSGFSQNQPKSPFNFTKSATSESEHKKSEAPSASGLEELAKPPSSGAFASFSQPPKSTGSPSFSFGPSPANQPQSAFKSESSNPVSGNFNFGSATRSSTASFEPPKFSFNRSSEPSAQTSVPQSVEDKSQASEKQSTSQLSTPESSEIPSSAESDEAGDVKKAATPDEEKITEHESSATHVTTKSSSEQINNSKNVNSGASQQPSTKQPSFSFGGGSFASGFGSVGAISNISSKHTPTDSALPFGKSSAPVAAPAAASSPTQSAANGESAQESAVSSLTSPVSLFARHGSTPSATKNAERPGFSPQSTSLSRGPSVGQQQASKESFEGEGLGAEFMKLIKMTDEDLLKLQSQVEQKLVTMAQYREPLQPVDDFPVSFDDGEWTMGDLHHLKSVSTQLSAVLSEVCGSQAKDHASLLELQNQCVKAQLKGAEIQRFLDNVSNPEFHRQLQAQDLGPEQAETQAHLRSLATATSDSLDQVEMQVERVQARIEQLRHGRSPLRVSSLEMIHQTMQNLSFSVNSKLTELTELSTRVDMLTKPHGNRNRRALPSSGADQSSLFKGTVCEENVTRIQESRRIKTSLRDRLLQARARPLLTCTEEPASGASREW